VSAAAGGALAAFRVVSEGLPTIAQLPLVLGVNALLGSAEALACLLGFALLGRFLGLRCRPPRG
jgi:hypothetical protein